MKVALPGGGKGGAGPGIGWGSGGWEAVVGKSVESSSGIVQQEARPEAGASVHQANARAFDRLAVGVILVDALGSALGMNRRARELVAAGDGLALDAGWLRAASPVESVILRRLIARTAASRSPSTGRGVANLSVTRPSGRHALELAIVPMAGKALPRAPAGRLVLVLVSDRRPARKARPLTALLGRDGNPGAPAALRAQGRSPRERSGNAPTAGRSHGTAGPAAAGLGIA
jgi:hypothetical protein